MDFANCIHVHNIIGKLNSRNESVHRGAWSQVVGCVLGHMKQLWNVKRCYTIVVVVTMWTRWRDGLNIGKSSDYVTMTPCCWLSMGQGLWGTVPLFIQLLGLVKATRMGWMSGAIKDCRFHSLTITNSPVLHKKATSQQTQNICITFVQCRPNVFDVGPTLYKCYTNVFFVYWDWTLLRCSRWCVLKSQSVMCTPLTPSSRTVRIPIFSV